MLLQCRAPLESRLMGSPFLVHREFIPGIGSVGYVMLVVITPPKFTCKHFLPHMCRQQSSSSAY